MRKLYKVISVILVIMIVISAVSITVSAESDSGTCGDNLTWTYDSSTFTLTISGTGSMYDYKYNNRPWESYIEDIQTAIVNDGVTAIGEYAFFYCTSINSITLPNTLTTINKDAFCGCESLTNIILPDGVTTICEYAFSHCFSLKSITIPDSVTTIGTEIFSNCYSIESITVDENNQHYSSDEYGVLFNKDKTTLIHYPIGNARIDSTTYTIPDSVTTVGDWAFGQCQKLTSIIIPESVTTIGMGAFYWCDNLADVYYSGTEEQWESISIGGDNYVLYRTNIHYDYCVHSYDAVITAPTCTEQGYTVYTCKCGDNYIDDYVDATGHSDGDNDGYCDECNEQLCDHTCHKSGLAKFFFKFVLFFQKIFGTNKVCECGVAHY